MLCACTKIFSAEKQTNKQIKIVTSRRKFIEIFFEIMGS